MTRDLLGAIDEATLRPRYGLVFSLIALLLWVNLSAQVILIATAFVIEGVAEQKDRVRVRYGARTFAARRVHVAEDAVRIAAAELEQARRAAHPASD